MRRTFGKNRNLLWAVAVFSIFAYILMLTGPLDKLQVYDRVLGSGSQETLVALSVLITFLYGMIGMLDYVRGRIMRRFARGFNPTSTDVCSTP